MIVMEKETSKARLSPGSAGSISRREINGYLFVLPVAAVLAALVVYPLAYGVYISFFKTNLVKKWTFVGLRYYLKALKSPEFLGQMLVTVKFTAGVVAGHFFFGMLLALLLNRNFRGRAVFRVIFLLPWLFPDSVVALLFKWILNPVYGIFNHVLMQLGLIDAPLVWLSNAGLALPIVVAICIWKGYPMIMMMLLAGLQSISDDVKEAARIDGANLWQSFCYVTLPGLRSVLTVTLVLDTVWWFKHYTLVWVLTQGGPGNTTSLISISIYKQAFDNFNFGSAAAMSVIVFLVCYLLGIIYRKVLEND